VQSSVISRIAIQMYPQARGRETWRGQRKYNRLGRRVHLISLCDLRIASAAKEARTQMGGG
jgi:hypothetical protein